MILGGVAVSYERGTPVQGLKGEDGVRRQPSMQVFVAERQNLNLRSTPDPVCSRVQGWKASALHEGVAERGGAEVGFAVPPAVDRRARLLLCEPRLRGCLGSQGTCEMWVSRLSEHLRTQG